MSIKMSLNTAQCARNRKPHGKKRTLRAIICAGFSVPIVLALVMTAPGVSAQGLIKVDKTNAFWIEQAKDTIEVAPDLIEKFEGVAKYAGLIGIASAFIFAEQQESFDDLKEELEKKWTEAIDDALTNKFLDSRKDESSGWHENLTTTYNHAEIHNNYEDAVMELDTPAMMVKRGITHLDSAHQKDPYPARPSLPYLVAAQSRYLDIQINRIKYLQKLIDDHTAREQHWKNNLLGVIDDYNKARQQFQEILITEKERAIRERNEMITKGPLREENKGNFAVTDRYINEAYGNVYAYACGGLNPYIYDGQGEGCRINARRFVANNLHEIQTKASEEMLKETRTYTLRGYPASLTISVNGTGHAG